MKDIMKSHVFYFVDLNKFLFILLYESYIPYWILLISIMIMCGCNDKYTITPS